MKLFIFGAGAHGRVVLDIFQSQNVEVTGFLDDDSRLHGQSVSGHPVLGGTKVLEGIHEQHFAKVIVALGNAPARLRLTEYFFGLGHTLENAIHKSAVISPISSIGRGVCVCAGVVVNPDAKIGDAVIINTSATIDHDCSVGDGTHISPGVHLAGRVRVGKLSFLGTGVAVVPRVTIGDNVIIGAGATVTKDIPDGVLAMGTPARVVRVLNETFDWSKLL